jgi:hypothetical protein
MKDRNMRHEKKRKQKKRAQKKKTKLPDKKRKGNRRKREKIKPDFTCSESNRHPCQTSHFPSHSTYTPACLPKIIPLKKSLARFI